MRRPGSGFRRPREAGTGLVLAVMTISVLAVACGGPGVALVTGTVEGSYPCSAAGSTCRQPIGIQALTFRSDDSRRAPVTARSDAGGRYSVRLPAGTWAVYVGSGATLRAEPTIHVVGLPAESLSVDVTIPIPAGAG